MIFRSSRVITVKCENLILSIYCDLSEDRAWKPHFAVAALQFLQSVFHSLIWLEAHYTYTLRISVAENLAEDLEYIRIGKVKWFVEFTNLNTNVGAKIEIKMFAATLTNKFKNLLLLFEKVMSHLFGFCIILTGGITSVYITKNGSFFNFI